MAHTNKTQFYELPQYLGKDKINPLIDTNGAYETIDNVLHNHDVRIASVEDIGTPKTYQLYSKGLTFNFVKVNKWVTVKINGTLNAAVIDGQNWTEIVPEDYRPLVVANSIPILPADINNLNVGIKIATNGAISADSGVGTIASGETISCFMMYPSAL